MINHKMRRLADMTRMAIELGVEYGLDLTAVAVDRGGHMVAALRSDLAGYMTLEPARGKAIAAMSLKFPTATIAQLLADDELARRAFESTPSALAVPGGFPVILDNVCIGGLGIAGGHYTEDHMIGERLLAHFARGESSSVASGMSGSYAWYVG